MAISATRCTPGAGRTSCGTSRDLYTFDPDGQMWARSMADLLIRRQAAATAARAAGQPRLGDAQLAEITAWYRGAVAKGITDNQNTAQDRP